MGGGDTVKKETTQSSETKPWEPAVPMLQSILSSLGGIGTGVTSGQSSALTNLNAAASGIPNLSPELTSTVTGALNTSTQPQQGMLTDTLKQLNTNIGGTASGAELNPYDTPGFKDAIATMTGDITNATKGVYAGSGRDPSGAGNFAGTLGQGLTKGIAPVIQSQFNTNKGNQMDAASKLFSAGGATAGGLTQQQMAELSAKFQGLQGAGALPGLLTAPAQAQLGAANASYSQPYDNIGMLSQLVNPIAGMGGSSSGTGTSTQETSRSLMSNIIGGATGLAGLNGAMGGGWLSSLGNSAMGFLGLSDERVKEDIEPVGETGDGQTIYSYHYIGSDVPQMGLLAQEVEKRDPGAVHDIGGGLKAVDYKRALSGAKLGMLKMAA